MAEWLADKEILIGTVIIILGAMAFAAAPIFV